MLREEMLGEICEGDMLGRGMLDEYMFEEAMVCGCVG